MTMHASSIGVMYRMRNDVCSSGVVDGMRTEDMGRDGGPLK